MAATPRKPKTGRVKLTGARNRALMAAARTIDKDEKQQIVARGKRTLAEFDELMDVVKVLKEERRQQGLTLEQLSRRTGIGKSNLSKLENGRLPNPTIDTLRRIAEALGRTIRVQLA